MNPRTVFVTGGSSGIGEGLARAYHANGATVIIGGRDASALERVAASCSGMATQVIDVADAHSVQASADELAQRYPNLNVVVNNAGVQRLLDFAHDQITAADINLEIDTNLKGMIYVTNAFLPLLRRQPSSRLVNVSSGLGFVPLVKAPIYSATKAAQHAFTIALRAQLTGTSVRVTELIPPVVATRLHRSQSVQPPRAMPLESFIAQAMRALESEGDELPIGLARLLRIGARVAPNQFLKIVNRA